MGKILEEKFMDGLIENAIGLDPNAMYELLKRMETKINVSTHGKDELDMQKTFQEEYMDDLIETAIGADADAMVKVLEKMESITGNLNNPNNHIDKQVSLKEKYMDNFVETVIGADPATMQNVVKQFDSRVETREIDRAFAEYVDELANGIDNQIKAYFEKMPLNWEMENINTGLKVDNISPNSIYDILIRIDERLAKAEKSLAELKAAI